MHSKASEKARIVLNWSRLLGFDQVSRPQRSESPMAKQALLAKVGLVKVGGKPR
jgi:hypothetical protein